MSQINFPILCTRPDLYQNDHIRYLILYYITLCLGWPWLSLPLSAEDLTRGVVQELCNFDQENDASAAAAKPRILGKPGFPSGNLIIGSQPVFFRVLEGQGIYIHIVI